MYIDKNVDEVEKLLGTSIEEGLTEEEAKRRIQQYGENRLKAKKNRSTAALFF